MGWYCTAWILSFTSAGLYATNRPPVTRSTEDQGPSSSAPTCHLYSASVQCACSPGSRTAASARMGNAVLHRTRTHRPVSAHPRIAGGGCHERTHRGRLHVCEYASVALVNARCAAGGAHAASRPRRACIPTPSSVHPPSRSSLRPAAARWESYAALWYCSWGYTARLGGPLHARRCTPSHCGACVEGRHGSSCTVEGESSYKSRIGRLGMEVRSACFAAAVTLRHQRRSRTAREVRLRSAFSPSSVM